MPRKPKTPLPIAVPDVPGNPIKKRGPGRPPASPDGFKYVLRLAGIGLTDKQIKQKLNITDRTWFRWLSDETDGEENRELLKQAKARAVSAIDEALFRQALQGKTGAAKQVLAQLAYGKLPWQR